MIIQALGISKSWKSLPALKKFNIKRKLLFEYANKTQTTWPMSMYVDADHATGVTDGLIGGRGRLERRSEWRFLSFVCVWW